MLSGGRLKTNKSSTDLLVSAQAGSARPPPWFRSGTCSEPHSCVKQILMISGKGAKGGPACVKLKRDRCEASLCTKHNAYWKDCSYSECKWIQFCLWSLNRDHRPCLSGFSDLVKINLALWILIFSSSHRLSILQAPEQQHKNANFSIMVNFVWKENFRERRSGWART